MRNDEYRTEFCRLVSEFNHRHARWQIWFDFLHLTAISIANSVPNINRNKREEQYLSIINKYTKEEQELFVKLFVNVTMALDENPEQDYLGSLFHALHLEQTQKGQFFTPYDVSKMMAMINLPKEDVLKQVNEDGYISISDPACGAGSLLIASANAIKDCGINYQNRVFIVAQDVDTAAALMCYIQLSLLGCSAHVIIGDSLAKPDYHPDNDVWITPMYYINSWRFNKRKETK